MQKIRQQEAVTSKKKKESRIGKNTKTNQSRQELTLTRQRKSEGEPKLVNINRPALTTQQKAVKSNNLDEKDRIELKKPIVPNLPRSMSEIM